MRKPRANALAFALLTLAAAPAGAALPMPELSGSVRALADLRTANHDSPLAPAADLLGAGRDCGVGELRLRASLAGFVAAGQALAQTCDPGGVDRDGRLDELFWEGGQGAWHATLGKKVLAWDVGYGFRPLDVIQKELRRALIDQQLEGVPVAMLEHFGASTSTGLVVTNIGKSDIDTGRDEQALVLRSYGQWGGVDAYGLARWGLQEHASLGAAFAWVPTEALEVHASARWGQRATRLVSTWPEGAPLVQQSPWSESVGGAFWQALAGTQWTGENKVSLLGEVWYDGTAPADSEWDAWQTRNADIAQFSFAPSAARAGNLAWQAQGLSRQNLRRVSALARIAYTGGTWQPALDALCNPADGGSTVTASLGWQGDQLRIDAGLRGYFGPHDALLRQLPDRAIAYAAVTLPF
ncbi:hypothetical protein [Niveibacterium sp. SC-1]|uniref:hypothetical protein n=1 Tax=Niveibacterium sp. SC-1 TaxID=3135646 RepID=UPI00311E1026